MPLEDLTGSTKYISDLDITSPAGGEGKYEGDDHIRGFKNVTLNTFPNITGAVTSTHTQLNYINITTPGAAEASKALVLDSSSNIVSGINSLNVATLVAGNVSGAFTGNLTGNANTATAITGVTSSVVELNKTDEDTLTTSFTPGLYGAVSGTGVRPVYSTQDGEWFNIGPIVFVSLQLGITNKNSISGNIIIDNLPKTSIGLSGGKRPGVSIGFFSGVNMSTGEQLTGVINVNDTTLALVLSGASSPALLATDITDSFVIDLSIVYMF